MIATELGGISIDLAVQVVEPRLHHLGELTDLAIDSAIDLAIGLNDLTDLIDDSTDFSTDLTDVAIDHLHRVFFVGAVTWLSFFSRFVMLQ